MPRKSNRRELIINTATARFLVSGYDVVTVDELCELTSSTKGSFYHFFANKEALAVDVVNHVWNETEFTLEEKFAPDGDAKTQLQDEIDRISRNYIRTEGKRHYIGCPIGTLAVSLRGKSQKLTRRLNFAMTHMRQFYLSAFEAARSAGHINSALTTQELADRYMLDLQGLSTLGKAQPGSRNVTEMALVLRRGLDDLFKN